MNAPAKKKTALLTMAEVIPHLPATSEQIAAATGNPLDLVRYDLSSLRKCGRLVYRRQRYQLPEPPRPAPPPVRRKRELTHNRVSNPQLLALLPLPLEQLRALLDNMDEESFTWRDRQARYRAMERAGLCRFDGSYWHATTNQPRASGEDRDRLLELIRKAGGVHASRLNAGELAAAAAMLRAGTITISGNGRIKEAT